MTSNFSRGFYRWVRDLHLYLGLFVSPFVVLFAASVFILNHGSAALSVAQPAPAVVTGLKIPAGVQDVQGAEQAKAVRPILDQLGVSGEINFIRNLRSERRLVIPVVKPGVETSVEVHLDTASATVTRRYTGITGALAWLHKFPGPHNANIRGNWFWTQCWRWLADGTVYLLLFISLSGLYLWAVLRAERGIGLILIGAGAASFVGLIYGLCR